tara:strand:+ start:8700 stop:9440 length:741 start_codon:yes stop_codon:yes gene_type:complete
MKIQTTTNLEQFHYDHRNRLIKPNRVKSMATSIQTHGQLQPIIVDNSCKVLDGQHRIEAIRVINRTAESPIAVSYIKRTIPMHLIAEMNSQQQEWLLSDWIHHYKQCGNENYIMLHQYSEKYKPIKMSALASFLHESNSAGSNTSLIRKGRFIIDVTPEKEFILSKLVMLSKIKPMFSAKCVLVAIMWLRRDPNFDAQRLFYALERNFESILKQSGTGNWARHMLLWYNKGLRSTKLNINDLPRHA